MTVPTVPLTVSSRPLAGFVVAVTGPPIVPLVLVPEPEVPVEPEEQDDEPLDPDEVPVEPEVPVVVVVVVVFSVFFSSFFEQPTVPIPRTAAMAMVMSTASSFFTEIILSKKN